MAHTDDSRKDDEWQIEVESVKLVQCSCASARNSDGGNVARLQQV